MSAALFLRSSRTVLLHASLAQLTPEVATLDSLIRGPFKNPLPAELLLIIRSYTLSLVTAQLLLNSEHTLAIHERILLSLLCHDCAAYNADVYGNNVFRWPWDQFSGPCACRSGDRSAYATRVNMFKICVSSLQSSDWLQGPLERQGDEDTFICSDSLQFTPRYLDANHVVEYHLSREARKFTRQAYKSELLSSRTTSSTKREPVCSRTRNFLRARTIWDVVSLVLQQYECEALEFTSSTTSTVDGEPIDGVCPEMLHEKGDSIMEMPYQSSHLSTNVPSTPTTYPSEPASAPVGTPPPPSDKRQSKSSPLWALLSHNPEDCVYISPLQQSQSLINVHGLQNTPRSWASEEDKDFQGLSTSPSEDERYPGSSHSRLVHTKRDLGLDFDYAQYCTDLCEQAKHDSDTKAGNQLHGSDFVDDMAMSGASAARRSNAGTTEATTTTFSPVPTSSNSTSPSSMSTQSVLSMALALIRNRSGCYRSSRSTTNPLRYLTSSGSGSGGCFHHGFSADPLLSPDCPPPSANSNSNSAPPSSLTLSPNQLLNTILHFFLTAASILGYSMYLTGFLVTLCISIPLAVIKVALTIVCFYSKPSSFRLV